MATNAPAVRDVSSVARQLELNIGESSESQFLWPELHIVYGIEDPGGIDPDPVLGNKLGPTVKKN